MKILELTLENFLPILAGMGKEKVTLNLRDSNELINVFIGKIGSGKTYLLSHLQPFSTVGTLDVRNSDDPIIEGKDGKKIIIYEKDGHEYIIEHDYTWNGKSHAKKSYIEKDGIQLNENGNSGSFKEWIQVEFGIDQSFLRLMRLGPNVVNFINMKATERKTYIASLLDSTDLYLSLYKAWNTELRTLNTKAGILMNKIQSYSNKSLDDLNDDLVDLDDSIMKISEEITELTKYKYELQAENKMYLNNMSYSEFKIKKSELLTNIDAQKSNIDKMKNDLQKYASYPSINEVSKTIGTLDSKLSTSQSNLSSLNESYIKLTQELNALKDKLMMSGNDEHMNVLQETYQSLLKQDDDYKMQLRNFKCEYSSAYLSGLLGDLNTINILINEICQYDKDTIQKLFGSDSSVIKFSKDKIEILGYRKLKVQKIINNLTFAEKYQPSSKLYFPPFCPTHNCPYYKTHPYTIQKQNSGIDEMLIEIKKYQNELKDIDIEIYKYNDYPMLYSKISTLKDYWKKVTPILSNIGALNHGSLLSVLTNSQYQIWYNYDKVIDTIDMLEKRDKYFELTEKIKIIKNEINELSLSDVSSLKEKISDLEDHKTTIENDIEREEINCKSIEDELISYNQMYVDLSEISVLESNIQNLSSQYDNNVKELSEMNTNDDKIQQNILLIQTNDIKLNELTSKLSKLNEDFDSLKTRINDIKYADNELSSTTTEIEYMSKMVNAVSTKKGIPLVMIELFLDSCRDTVNDMLYAVCEDDLEILPFKINDTEFNIPYMVNGQIIDDISKASQGQSSIVSTAMSFALVKQVQGGDFGYNIPLLDEIDGPLHKSDKQKFIAILLKYLSEIHSEQCFVITHDDSTFDGYPVQVIMTTDENVNRDKYTNVIKL